MSKVFIVIAIAGMMVMVGCGKKQVEPQPTLRIVGGTSIDESASPRPRQITLTNPDSNASTGKLSVHIAANGQWAVNGNVITCKGLAPLAKGKTVTIIPASSARVSDVVKLVSCLRKAGAKDIIITSNQGTVIIEGESESIF